ncbi:MAG: prepilin-type N-terminal cleavage/methylation domain-containing protein [Bdellovibrio sp.]|nr:prepilin-type N-terminal cleavage/methylation domain-containing protein [Bdellovibrio sp.]
MASKIITRHIHNSKGFTLLEVMIALTIFAVFAVMFVAGQSGNLADSLQMREESLLRILCVNKINEILNSPPEFNEQLTLSKEKKTFEDYPEYEYTLEYKKLKIPDLSKLAGKQSDEETDTTDESEQTSASLNTTVLKNIKENLQNMVWQVRVTVTNKKTGFFYSLAAWPPNKNAKVKFDGF